MQTETPIRAASPETSGLVQPWEVGGFFPHCGSFPGERIPWPQRHVLFGLARHIVPAIVKVKSSIRRLWVPDYFCPDVLQHWSGVLQTLFYRDDPSRIEPDWKSLEPDKRDLVMAVNYFGVRSKEPWQQWRLSHDCILLEDHTHDPVSSWALSSTADYVFSSLRKSLPLTDGAVCWSPVGADLPTAEAEPDAAAIDWKLNAMLQKGNFLQGKTSIEAKEHYRELYTRGDSRLEEGPECSISGVAREHVQDGIPLEWRAIREGNVRRLLSSLNHLTFAKPLFVRWPEGNAPFAAVLVFAKQEQRDSCRSFLERHHVFCPIHWTVGQSTVACDLSARILSIPTDQRYNEADMERVASLLQEWSSREVRN